MLRALPPYLELKINFKGEKNIQTLITLNYQNWPLKITIKKKEAFIIAAFLHKHTIQVAYNNYAYAK